MKLVRLFFYYLHLWQESLVLQKDSIIIGQSTNKTPATMINVAGVLLVFPTFIF